MKPETATDEQGEFGEDRQRDPAGEGRASGNCLKGKAKAVCLDLSMPHSTLGIC